MKQPEGETSTVIGLGRRKGPTDGGGRQQLAEEGSHTAQQKQQKTKTQQHRGGTQRRREDSRKTTGRNTIREKRNKGDEASTVPFHSFSRRLIGRI